LLALFPLWWVEKRNTLMGFWLNNPTFFTTLQKKSFDSQRRVDFKILSWKPQTSVLMIYTGRVKGPGQYFAAWTGYISPCLLQACLLFNVNLVQSDPPPWGTHHLHAGNRVNHFKCLPFHFSNFWSVVSENSSEKVTLYFPTTNQRACVKSWLFKHQIKWMRIVLTLQQFIFDWKLCLDFQLINVNKWV